VRCAIQRLLWRKKMTSRRFIWVVAALAAGCPQLEGVKGNGQIKREKREVKAFDRVEGGGAYTLAVEVGEPARLELRTDENLLPLVETKVSGGRLSIRSLKNLRPTEEVEVTVVTPKLRGLAISGAVKGKVSGVDSARFSLKLSGAGSVELGGKVGELELSLSGAGSVRARGLEAKRAAVRSSGAGSVQVFASESLELDLSGVGSVTYFGKPEKLKKSVSGVGSVKAGD
jgi:hypothetical protein